MKWIKVITISVITVCYLLLISGYHHLDYVLLPASKFNRAIILRPSNMSDQMIIWIFWIAFAACAVLYISLELSDIYQTRNKTENIKND